MRQSQEVQHPRAEGSPGRGRAVLTGLLLLVAGLTGASPADAITKPDVTISLGVPYVITDTAPAVPGYVPARRAEAAPTPENCEDLGTADAYCHKYKVHLDVPAEVRERGGFLLTAVLEWERTEVVTNVPQLGGSASTNQVIMRIYEEPKYVDPETEAETYTAASGLNSPSPTVLAVTDPVKPFYYVLVANYVGAENDYKLTLEVKDLVGGGPPVDLSAEEELPPIFDNSAFAPASSPDSLAVSGPDRSIGINGTPAAAALPSLPGLGAPDLALDGIGGSGLDDSDLREAVLASGPRPLAPPGEPSNALMLLWLVVVPLIALGVPVFLVWRRRREAAAAT